MANLEQALGPKGIPVFGNVFQMGGDPLDYYSGLHAEYGDAVKLKLGPMEAWSFCSAEAIHQILVTQHKIMRKGVGYQGLRMFLGEGLITTDKAHWADERKRLNAIFTPTSIDKYSSAILDACIATLPELNALADSGKPVDIGDAMTRLTMRVVSKTTFGVDLGEGPSDIIEAFDVAFTFITDVTAQPLRAPLFVPTAKNKKYKWALSVIDGFTRELIERSKSNLDTSEMNGRIFESLSGIDEELLRDEVISLYFAGFETTARTMTFMMDLLGRDPEILARLRAETDGAGDLAKIASVTKSLPMASEIVNEALRIYPPVAMMARQTNVDCEIGGHEVKADSLVIVLPYVAQRAVQNWPAGDAFAPDPDKPLAKRLTHRGAYAPFGAGPRICLGKHFALVELVLAISLVCREFDWTLVDSAPMETDFHGTLRPKNPILVNLSRRK